MTWRTANTNSLAITNTMNPVVDAFNYLRWIFLECLCFLFILRSQRQGDSYLSRLSASPLFWLWRRGPRVLSNGGGCYNRHHCFASRTRHANIPRAWLTLLYIITPYTNTLTHINENEIKIMIIVRKKSFLSKNALFCINLLRNLIRFHLFSASLGTSDFLY